MSELLPKILVVDDETWNLELMEAYLSDDYELAMATLHRF
ncbi:CheY-like chemotaxis protein [Methanococcoides alaskense]|uniref:CheY-like chemotaxis protein n=1 Tax=Methanococcoides alaskense TaxID=325778 RepID=A0AA90ZCS2_9EURY|nr:CheY-like chemotaxis protein [Methanococcoides alaskense]